MTASLRLPPFKKFKSREYYRYPFFLPGPVNRCLQALEKRIAKKTGFKSGFLSAIPVQL
jgi:hypothetical protein